MTWGESAYKRTIAKGQTVHSNDGSECMPSLVTVVAVDAES